MAAIIVVEQHVGGAKKIVATIFIFIFYFRAGAHTINYILAVESTKLNTKK